VTTIIFSYVKGQVCRARLCSAPSWPSVPIRPSLSLIARWRCLLRTGRRRRRVSRCCHRLAGTPNRTGDRWLRWASAVRSYRPTVSFTARPVYPLCHLFWYSKGRSLCITRYPAMKTCIKEVYTSNQSINQSSGATALQGFGWQSSRRRSAKLVPTFADRGVSRGHRNGSPRPLISVYRTWIATYFIEVAPQLTSRGRVYPVPDPLPLRKSGSAGNRTRDLYL